MRILFVCTGNSFGSPVAEALLKTLRGDLEADSAGTHPASMIAPNAKRLLEKMNAAKNLKKTPEGVDQKNLEEYNLIVAMEEQNKNHIIHKRPPLKDRIIVWNIDDPYFLPTGSDRRILREIEENVKELSASL